MYDQFRGDAQGAIRQLMKMEDGEAIGALHHEEIGDIDLVWGKAGTKNSDGYGLAKLVKYHPEVLDNLQGILDGMHVTKRSENRVQLESDEYQASVRLTWNGEEKLWLLTAFKKKETSEPTNSRTDVDSNLEGKSDDTATRQNSDVSESKSSQSSASVQGNGEKSAENNAVAPYTIEPATYTNKKGKTTEMHLVKFDHELTKEQKSAGKELAKESRGWWDAKQGGFMMRSEEAAKELAEALGSEEAVKNAQPMSAQDMEAANDKGAKGTTGKKAKTAKKPKAANRVDVADQTEEQPKTEHQQEKAKRGMPRTPEAKRTEAERLGQKFNTRLNIIEDTNAIVHTDPKIQARRRKAKGWYDTRTGEVTIVLPNNMNVEDVAETVFHETVGHKGLRELIGEKGYSDFLREVYAHAKADVRRRIAKIAAKHNWDFDKATDEYLSKLAEKGFEDFDREERSMWQWLKEKVMKAIDKFLKTLKLPKSVKLGDNELRYMLWRSKERLERGKEDFVDMARDIVKREELGLSEGNFNDKSRNSEPKPIGRSLFGSVYNQFKGKVLQAVKFLANHESGDLLGVFHRKDIGDIDMVWGDEGGGLCHILYKHINNKDFPTVKELVSRIEDIINNGEVDTKHSNADKLVLVKDGYLVTIRRNVREKGVKIADKNWILTAYNKDAPATTKAPADGTHGSTAVAPGTSSAAKVATLSEINKLSDNDVSDEDIMYRDGDSETEDIWKDGSLGLQERITAAATRLANNHKDNKTLRNDAMRAIGGNITMHLPLAAYLIASLLLGFMSGLTDIMFEGHGPYV